MKTDITPDGYDWPNVSDFIARYIQTHFPELESINNRPFTEVIGSIFEQTATPQRKTWGIWVTGSRIWKQVYAVEPHPEADWDIFVSNSQELEFMQTLLGKIQTVPTVLDPKMTTSLGGEIHYTTRGRVDLWQCSNDVWQQLATYPQSHKHCRAAYNPSNRATIVFATHQYGYSIDTAKEYAQAERLAMYYTEKAERLKRETT